MKVRAKFSEGHFGFYGGRRRRNGDVFRLEHPSHFSKIWMVNLDAPGASTGDEEGEEEGQFEPESSEAEEEEKTPRRGRPKKYF